MRFFKIAPAFLAIACSTASQDLPPELLVLAHIKAHMREELSRATNYTCLETTTRSQGGHGSKLQPLDTVRLEIVYDNHHEWYGSPGGKNLSESNPVAFIGSGMIGTGFFGIILSNLFLSDTATFTYRGEETIGGRPAVRYDFRLPRLLGGIKISLVGGSGTVGEQGSFWADPQTLDLLRLESQAAEIPPYLPLAEMRMSVNYARTRMGDGDALLAQEADLHMLQTPNRENYNHLEYTYCRTFSARSTIHFDSEPQASAKPLPADRSQDGAVMRKGKILIPDGSVVRGRIRRLERYNAAEFIVGLEFTEVEVNRESRRFYADLLRMDRLPGIRTTLKSTGNYQTQKITLPELPGVASFFVTGTTLTIPPGFRTVWRTRGVVH